MKFFIDTANVKEIREAAGLGVVDGPISAEAVSLEADKMAAEGVELAKIHKNIVVKLPMTKEGLKATKILAEKGIKVNMTLVFSPMQALLAAKVGAAYVSPFVGRLDDISHYGMDLVRQIVTIYSNYGYGTEVIVASVRNPLHVGDAALAGAHISTIPFSVIDQLVKHPLTDIGIDKFLADWKKLEKK